MAVITPDGIVGKVRDVFGHTSQVLVISDQTSGAGVLLESTRLRGVLRGNALGQPQIINMLPDERVKPGERVITSGGDQIFPRGLPVGVVTRVVEDTSNPPYVDILIKPAANLGHVEELLVITESSDRMSPTAQQDMAQSAAEGAAVVRQRASDILAERLPGLNDPNALADPGPGQKPAALPADKVLPPIPKPPPTLHADHYSPNATPPAAALTPGQGVVDPKYAPAPKPQVSETAPARPGAESKTTASKPDHTGVAEPPKTEGAAVKPKRPATSPATTGPEAVPGTTHSAVAKPKVPKVTEPAAPPAPADNEPATGAGDGSQPH
jgi:rod shape-determining protein MreC